jgi:hypothetical protein
VARLNVSVMKWSVSGLSHNYLINYRVLVHKHSIINQLIMKKTWRWLFHSRNMWLCNHTVTVCCVRLSLLSLSLHWRYSSGWASASFKSFLHPSRFRATTDCFDTLALLLLPSIHLPNAAWFSLWGAFLLAHWRGFSWLNHRHPGVWHETVSYNT